jgi:topoisomerase-4 subunit A
LKRVLVREIEADAKTHGDARRTLIQEEKKAVAEIRVVDEPVTVVVSAKGWVRALKGHEVDPAALTFKPGDALYGTYACRSVDTLLVFGSACNDRGRVYSVAVSLLPGGRGDGVPITSLIDLETGSQIAHYFAGASETRLLLANSGGYGLLAQVADMVGRNRGGKAFLTLDATDRVLPPVPVAPKHTQVACLAGDGRLLVYGLDELKLQPGGGKGLTLMAVDVAVPLLSVVSLAVSLTVQGSGRGGKPREELLKGASLAQHLGKRARKGLALGGFVKVLRLVAD